MTSVKCRQKCGTVLELYPALTKAKTTTSLTYFKLSQARPIAHPEKDLQGSPERNRTGAGALRQYARKLGANETMNERD